jgi:hypothetical protein
MGILKSLLSDLYAVPVLLTGIGTATFSFLHTFYSIKPSPLCTIRSYHIGDLLVRVTCRWWRNHPPKRLLNFNGLRGVMF